MKQKLDRLYNIFSRDKKMYPHKILHLVQISTFLSKWKVYTFRENA